VSRIFVKPGGADRRVPIPGRRGQFVPGGGIEMELTTYVQRRLACGDLVESTAPAPAVAPIAAPAPSASKEK
jgi:hypothetical protein